MAEGNPRVVPPRGHAPSAPVAGAVAPPLFIRSLGQEPISLLNFAQEPLVLAFLRDWNPIGEGRKMLGAARSELRGLGSVLLALSSQGLWFFRPDNDIQLFATPRTWNASDVEASRSSYGGVGIDWSGIFVIDANQIVRFARAPLTEAEATFEKLVDALSMAGRALCNSPRVPAAGVAARASSIWQPSRREVLVGSLIAGCSMALGLSSPASADSPSAVGSESAEIEVTLRVNGKRNKLRVDPRTSLLDTLRERLSLTGTKKGCDHGQCGACTVVAGGRRILACLTLAVTADGTEVATIEGLANGETLHPLQRTFVAEDGLQCGYCTPGQIMSAMGLLSEGHAHTEAEIREEMSGNICRCGAYPNIVTAIQRAHHPSGEKA